MSRLERLLLALLGIAAAAGASPAWAQAAVDITLDEVLRVAGASPRVRASERDTDSARAEREAASALPSPTLSLGSSRPASGARTIFDANRMDQIGAEIPLPVFGQREARLRAAEHQVVRAESAVRLADSDVKRLAALEFLHLLAAQEQQSARLAALAEIERLRDLVSGRLASGMASRYDLARTEAESALATLDAQRAQAEAGEHARALAGILGQPALRPRAAGSLRGLLDALRPTPGDTLPPGSPGLRVAQEEALLADARFEQAQRERYPVLSLNLGRSWTSGPFGAANFIGLTSEIPLSGERRALADKARAEAEAARERERATAASLRADYTRHREALLARRAALEHFEQAGFGRQKEYLEMAESAYRLGRSSLFELLDARRTQLDAVLARQGLLGAIIESEIEMRALLGDL